MRLKEILFFLELCVTKHVEVNLERGIVWYKELEYPVAGYRTVNVIAPFRLPSGNQKNSKLFYSLLDRVSTALNQKGLANFYNNVTQYTTECQNGELTECDFGWPALKLGKYSLLSKRAIFARNYPKEKIRLNSSLKKP